jgi:hypothetical protein
MSNSNVIVSLVFEEMAEEENLFSTQRADCLLGLYPTIDKTQVKILEGIIISRAQRMCCSQLLLREAFLNAYQIEDTSDLLRRRFEEAVEYLAKFMGVN